MYLIIIDWNTRLLAQKLVNVMQHRYDALLRNNGK